MDKRIAFIGGGNMASAIIGGLLRQGALANDIDVIEPLEAARNALMHSHGVIARPDAGDFLAQAALVVWAVKPQTFRAAAEPVQSYTRHALHLSVAAGIPSQSIARWVGSERVVRAMPNTPALIGRGITALFARHAVSDADRVRVEEVIATTGELLWLNAEDQINAVTALSGSGPAYVFYFLEAMRAAGADMGLSTNQAYQLAVATFVGAAELARTSSEAPEMLRQRVTSPGGTTHAAISTMEQHHIKEHFMLALQAARQRAAELGDEFGAS